MKKRLRFPEIKHFFAEKCDTVKNLIATEASLCE